MQGAESALATQAPSVASPSFMRPTRSSIRKTSVDTPRVEEPFSFVPN